MADTPQLSRPPDKLLLTVPEIAAWLGTGRDSTYAMAAAGEFGPAAAVGTGRKKLYSRERVYARAVASGEEAS